MSLWLRKSLQDSVLSQREWSCIKLSWNTVDAFLTEEFVCTQYVGLYILGSLVTNFDSILRIGLGISCMSAIGGGSFNLIYLNSSWAVEVISSSLQRMEITISFSLYNNPLRIESKAVLVMLWVMSAILNYKSSSESSVLFCTFSSSHCLLFTSQLLLALAGCPSLLELTVQRLAFIFQRKFICLPWSIFLLQPWFWCHQKSS